MGQSSRAGMCNRRNAPSKKQSPRARVDDSSGIIEVLGLGVGYTPDAQTLATIGHADALAAGERLLSKVSGFIRANTQTIVLTTPLEKAFAGMAKARDRGNRVVVLADGDPLFFGIASSLMEYFGQDALCLTPAVTAVAAACARFKLAWHDLPVVSLHGRSDMTPLLGALASKGRAALYTDAANSPDALAGKLLDLDIADVVLRVVENMGTPDERARTLRLREAAALSFSPLNMVIVETVPEKGAAPMLGSLDAFYEKQNGLITKWPTRACALAALRLRPDCVLWDVGAGSGAVSVEACALVHSGRVFALERDPGRCRLIHANRKRFRAWLMEIVEGEAPRTFATLPDPDRIFLGGGLSGGLNAGLDAKSPAKPKKGRLAPKGALCGNVPELLAEACSRLKPGGRLVANTVLFGSLHAVLDHLNGLGWPVETTQIQAHVSAPLAGDARFRAQNPVFIVCADKPAAPMLA